MSDTNTNRESETMRKVTITDKAGRVGVLTLAADGRYDIALDGKAASPSTYYTRQQVEAVVAKHRAQGSVVVIEA